VVCEIAGQLEGGPGTECLREFRERKERAGLGETKASCGTSELLSVLSGRSIPEEGDGKGGLGDSRGKKENLAGPAGIIKMSLKTYQKR